MYYSEIKKTDIANGPGVRVSLFVSGCNRHCKNCFNKETWSFTNGSPFDEAAQLQLIAALAPQYINGLTLLGGEPMEKPNQQALLPFVQRVKQAYPQKDIWCYTGCTLERDLCAGGAYHCSATDELLTLIDTLVDGEFIEERKDIRLAFRGSANQRIIDMQRTRQTGRIIMRTDLDRDKI